jgi:hypothetical protein
MQFGTARLKEKNGQQNRLASVVLWSAHFAYGAYIISTANNKGKSRLENYPHQQLGGSEVPLYT